jgi:hypothetical protein
VWRYYPNKITGTETVKNWYLERIKLYIVETYDWGKAYREKRSKRYFYNEVDRDLFMKEVKSNHLLDIETCKHDPQLGLYTLCLLCITVAATLTSLLLEYLIANFFIPTLVAGLAVGLHFIVVLLGKKLYSVSEDVKLLKKAAATEKAAEGVATKKEET